MRPDGSDEFVQTTFSNRSGITILISFESSQFPGILCQIRARVRLRLFVFFTRFNKVYGFGVSPIEKKLTSHSGL